MNITAIIILIVVVVAVINTIYSTIYKVVNMPSAPNTRRVLVEDIKSLKSDRYDFHICDCGSGWGGLCGKLSNAFPNAMITGIEISPIPFLVSYLNPFRKYQVKRGNLFKTDLSQADILIFYLSPYHMDLLSHKLLNEVKKGTVIYSQGFPIKEWKVSQEIIIPCSLEKKMYRYDL